VSPCCCTKQRGLANGVSPVHVGAALDQTGDLLYRKDRRIPHLKLLRDDLPCLWREFGG
jgi:hypothetical protein